LLADQIPSCSAHKFFIEFYIFANVAPLHITTKMKRFLLIFSAMLIVAVLNAQMYTPIDTSNLDQRKKESAAYLLNAKKYLSDNLKQFSGGERSFIKKQCEKRNKIINEKILKGECVFDARFDSLLNALVDRIVAANPSIPTGMRFYVTRDLSLNGSSLGNGSFMLNIGSFYYLQNEDQLASLLAHEIGHLCLKHTEYDILELYTQEHSDDLGEVVDGINRQKYNKGDIATSKLKELLYQNGAKDKKQELESDSIGYVYYRNAKFRSSEFVHSLKLLAEYDTLRPKGLDSTVYKTVFNLPNQPFKKEWMKMEDFSSYDYTKYKERFNEDSIEAHPETMVRIERLRLLFPEVKDFEKSEPTNRFLQLQKIAEMEQFPSLYIKEKYGIGLYLCLLKLQNHPDDKYTKKWLGEFLFGLAKARKEYTLNRYLDRINPKDQSESYRQFISFMWNLTLSELQNTADYYTKKEL
jgi:hypothetical protein